MLGHKTSLGEFKETEIISSVFCEHNGVKLQLQEKEGKSQTNGG